jgi:heptosyltransferase-3
MQKILVINLKHFGDVLTTTPLLPALRDHFPRSKITYLVRAGMEVMVEEHPLVERVITLDPPDGNMFAKLRYQLAFLRKLRRERFDLVLELSRGDRGAILAFASLSPVRVGYENEGSGIWGRSRLFTHLVPYDPAEEKHTIEVHNESLRILGVKKLYTQMSFYWSADDEDTAKEILRQEGLEVSEHYALMHPTSRWMFKAWTSGGYAAVADHIQEIHGLAVVLTSGPAEEERKLVAEIKTRLKKPVIDLSGRLSLKQLGFLIHGSRLFVGIDTAPMHMASALEVPLVAVFGPSGSHMWGPLGERKIVARKDWDCLPCGKDGCDGSKISKCLVELEPAEVSRAVDRLLSEDGGLDESQIKKQNTGRVLRPE